jgi:hypothetical protein
VESWRNGARASTNPARAGRLEPSRLLVRRPRNHGSGITRVGVTLETMVALFEIVIVTTNRAARPTQHDPIGGNDHHHKRSR